MAICDARYNFWFYDIGQYGSTNNSAALANSDFGKAFSQHLFHYPAPEKIPGSTADIPLFLVGDEIFPLKEWLMRPYPGSKKGTMEESKFVFNYRLSRARRVIENTFGILVARWRIFRSFIRATPENVERYVLAGICLHNYLRQTDNAGYCPAGFVDSEDSSGQIIAGDWRSITGGDVLTHLQRPHNTRCTDTAFDTREALKTYVNGPGAVPWQLHRVRRTGGDAEK